MTKERPRKLLQPNRHELTEYMELVQGNFQIAPSSSRLQVEYCGFMDDDPKPVSPGVVEGNKSVEDSTVSAQKPNVPSSRSGFMS